MKRFFALALIAATTAMAEPRYSDILVPTLRYWYAQEYGTWPETDRWACWGDAGGDAGISRWDCDKPAPSREWIVSNYSNALAMVAERPVVQSIGAATVKTYSDGTMEIVGPLVVQGTTNGAYEITVDPETGLVLGELDHASPRKTKAEKDAAKAARRAKIAAVKKATTRNDKVDALLDLLGLK